jgi:hypothetical protein
VSRAKRSSSIARETRKRAHINSRVDHLAAERARWAALTPEQREVETEAFMASIYARHPELRRAPEPIHKQQEES